MQSGTPDSEKIISQHLSTAKFFVSTRMILSLARKRSFRAAKFGSLAESLIRTGRHSTIMKQRAKQRLGYANAVFGSVTNQRDRLISKEPDSSSAFLPHPLILASWNLLDIFYLPLYQYFSLFLIFYPSTLSDRFISPSALSRKASRFDALNRPFHWQSGYYETFQKVFKKMSSRSPYRWASVLS